MLLDAKGHELPPSEPIAREMFGVARAMSRRLAEGIYGGSPDDRVFQLRKSVLGDDAGPAPRYAGSLEGLAAWLPTTNPGEG